jgi:2-oxoacid:acceptor oxidoreductase gamma subunit (pyruvate/2-ketoisovalerate family)
MEQITEFRLHGRGGQGIVIAAAVFAEAVFREGYLARAFSLFGAERRGAPVTAFVRVSRAAQMPRCRIYEPDCVAALDATISRDTVMAGLKAGGTLLLNAPGDDFTFFSALPPGHSYRTYRVEASSIAARHNLAIGGFPVSNTVMVGALARITGLASLDSVLAAVEKRIAARRDDNMKAAAEGYHQVEEVLDIAQ